MSVQKIWLQSLGQEDPLEKGMETHSSILAWEFLWTEEPDKAVLHGVSKTWTQLSDQNTMKFEKHWQASSQQEREIKKQNKTKQIMLILQYCRNRILILIVN